MRRCLQHCDPVCHTLVAWRHTGLFLCHRAVARRHRAAALTQRPEPAAWTRPHPLPSSVTRVAGTPAPADEALSILRSDDSQLLDLVAAARRNVCAMPELTPTTTTSTPRSRTTKTSAQPTRGTNALRPSAAHTKPACRRSTHVPRQGAAHGRRSRNAPQDAAHDAPAAEVPATLPCGKSAPPAGASAGDGSVTVPTIRRRGAGTALAPNA